MSSLSKLIVATTLVVGGYGVASFLGSPNAPYLAPATRAALEHHALTHSKPSPAETKQVSALDVARLIPEIASNESVIGSTSPPPWLRPAERQAFEEAPATIAQHPPSLLPPDLEAIPLREAIDPFARGSTERELVEDHSRHPDTDGSVAPDATVASSDAPPSAGRLVDVHWNAPELGSSAADQTAVTIGSTPVVASHSMNVADSASRAVAETESIPSAPVIQATMLPPIEMAAPTFPMTDAARSSTDDRDNLRTHIVIDGDTLERIAERYLDDPSRAGEIYELNHEWLDHPELLPIGSELKMPARFSDKLGQFDTASVMRAHSETAIHLRNNTASATPSKAESPDMPRAQLLHPLPASWQPTAPQ